MLGLSTVPLGVVTGELFSRRAFAYAMSRLFCVMCGWNESYAFSSFFSASRSILVTRGRAFSESTLEALLTYGLNDSSLCSLFSECLRLWSLCLRLRDFEVRP